MKNNLLWDLDGTLTDPRAGIIRCFQYALKEANLPIHEERELLWVIGPPIQHSFSKLVPEATDAQIWALVAKYRERFIETGMFENEPYDGIQELLRCLKDKTNFIATSKPQVFAEKILNHFDLSQFFTGIYGSELDGQRSDKGELIGFLLDREKISPSEAIMVGDREHDILGAKKAGIQSVGVTWGYGSITELENAGADYVFRTPEELRKFLLS